MVIGGWGGWMSWVVFGEVPRRKVNLHVSGWLGGRIWLKKTEEGRKKKGKKGKKKGKKKGVG